MSAVVLQIADAVVDIINSADLDPYDYAPSFTAQRFYVPVYDLQRDLKTLKVTVVPIGLSLENLTRNSDDFTYQVDIAVQQRIGNDALTEAQIQAACDPLMLLMEQIIDLFRGKDLAAVQNAACLKVENPAIYIPHLLDEDRVFTSFATLTYKLARPRP